MSGRIIPTVLGKGRRFPGIGPPPTFWSFMVTLELSWHLWLCHLAYANAAVPSLFGTGDRFRGRQVFHERGGGGVVQAERWAAAAEASLTRPPITSCCATWFLTGRGLLAVRGAGVADPCDNVYNEAQSQSLLEVKSSATLDLVGSNQFMLYPQRLCHSFKDCALPASLPFHWEGAHLLVEVPPTPARKQGMRTSLDIALEPQGEF